MKTIKFASESSFLLDCRKKEDNCSECMLLSSHVRVSE